MNVVLRSIVGLVTSEIVSVKSDSTALALCAQC
jgi:hypothetical protein